MGKQWVAGADVFSVFTDVLTDVFTDVFTEAGAAATSKAVNQPANPRSHANFRKRKHQIDTHYRQYINVIPYIGTKILIQPLSSHNSTPKARTELVFSAATTSLTCRLRFRCQNAVLSDLKTQNFAWTRSLCI